MLGVNKGTVGGWERRGDPPQRRLRERVASALGLEPVELCRLWGLPPEPGWATVTPLDRGREDRDPPVGDAAPARADAVRVVDPALRRALVEALVVGLREGHAASPTWVAAAAATAKTVGVP